MPTWMTLRTRDATTGEREMDAVVDLERVVLMTRTNDGGTRLLLTTGEEVHVRNPPWDEFFNRIVQQIRR